MADPYSSRILYTHLYMLRYKLRLRRLPGTILLVILRKQLSVL